MTFAQRLETLRIQKGLTQEELARLINISQPSYCAYERGKNKPSKNTQIQLAKVLKVSVDELMNGSETQTPTAAVEPTPEPEPTPDERSVTEIE